MMFKRNKNNTIFIVFCGLIVLIAVIWYPARISMGREKGTDRNLTPLERSFYATGAELEDVSVNAWVQLPGGDQTVEELTKVAGDTASALADPGTELEFKTSVGISHTVVYVSGKNSRQNMLITVQIIRPLAEMNREKIEAYLTVNMEVKGKEVNVAELERKISTFIGESGHQFSITTCLSGWVSGKLEEEKMQRLIRQAFRKVQAHVAEGITSPHFVSYAGATPVIDRSATVGKRVINLNIAMRHHSTEERTYVTAASPLITREY